MSKSKQKKVAAIVTEYRPRSHADVIVGRLIGRHYFKPRIKVASLYTEQVPSNDISREEAEWYGFPIFSTIKEAVTVGGPADPVDGILIIGEHGDYPTNEKRQKMYPRRRLVGDVLKVMDDHQLRVPVFSDKHLAYDMQDAFWIHDQIRERGLPFMGGSSIPLTDTDPPVADAEVRHANEIFVVSWSSAIEGYGFHGMEVLQAIAEKRAGGETGVESIRAIEGTAVWKAMDRKEWPEDLLLSALERFQGQRDGHPREHVAEPVLFMVDYRDGTKGYVIQLEDYVNRWLSAVRTEEGQILSSQCLSSRARPHDHFERFTQYIEDMVLTGESKIPMQRTLMTTGLINLGMESLYRQKRVQTPELHIQY